MVSPWGAPDLLMDSLFFRTLLEVVGSSHLTLEVSRHLMKRILVNSGSVVNLLYLPTLVRLGYKPDNLRNPGRVMVRFNGTQIHSLGEIVLPILEGPIIVLVPLTVLDEPSNFNAILGRTWIHAMKALPSSYH